MTKLIQNPVQTASKLPDGPQTPIWLQTIQLIAHPFESLEAARACYGDIFTPSGGVRMVVTGSP